MNLASRRAAEPCTGGPGPASLRPLPASALGWRELPSSGGRAHRPSGREGQPAALAPAPASARSWVGAQGRLFPLGFPPQYSACN